jgi:20S proteasome subunit alpha 7
MSGSGYDLSTTTYSPEGRIFQTEYAGKCVDNSGTAIGFLFNDGVILANERAFVSPMLVPGTNRRIYAINKSSALSVAGLVADGKEIVERARSEAAQYKQIYDEEIPPRVLAERIAMYVHAFTQYGSVRPFGATVLLAAFDTKSGKPCLFTIDPSGTVTKNYGNAVGKGRQLAKSSIEKLNLSELGARDALYNAARILLKGQDKDTEKERQNDFEYLWISKATEGVPSHVPEALVKEVEDEARNAIQIEEEA